MQYETLLPHYDDLLRLAASRCRTQADAEDLVAETMLAALTFLQRGGTIAHPRTWLANTLMHKHNSALRRAYRAPVVVNYDALDAALSDDDPPFDDTIAEADADEAAALRRALLYLGRTTREVLIRHYYANESVAAIAQALHIPEGTVKSRLAAGRAQIRKGMETMEQKKNHIPATLNISWGGTLGRNRAPASLIESDLIAQNLLILAYERPLTATELAQAIGIPTVYIEPILSKLVDGELMVQTGDRYYTDFILYTPEDYTRRLPAQLDFVRDHFDALWAPLAVLTEKIAALDFTADYPPQKKQKLVRYAVITALQTFKQSFIDRAEFDFPRRRDGGRWNAFGTVIPADMPKESGDEIDSYCLGGERTSGGDCKLPGAKKLQLREYDTPFYDHPGRPGIVGWDAYFDHIHELLWCLHRGIDLAEAKIPNALIEAIPSFIVAGMLVREDDRLLPGIPVLRDDEFKAVRALTNEASAALSATLSEAFRALMHRAAVQLPPHLTGVPEFRRCQPAIFAFELAVERAAWERGLHMRGVDACCPPVVMVWE